MPVHSFFAFFIRRITPFVLSVYLLYNRGAIWSFSVLKDELSSIHI
ncbi:hypothetical protein KIS4809_2757 [Bacillus sp. ZZV12-4809]|nr:hypothetical protein KIS4809_2757 [Bacillus sp. ZZV12-4809]